MIATIIIVSLAFAWLMHESKGLTIRIEQYESLEDFDKRILTAMLKDDDAQYQEWLQRRYADKLVRGHADTTSEYPQYKWMVKEENRNARQNGEMIYQRGRNF